MGCSLSRRPYVFLGLWCPLAHHQPHRCRFALMAGDKHESIISLVRKSDNSSNYIIMGGGTAGCSLAPILSSNFTALPRRFG
ncbi:hypothetical protein LINGRAHAP2_LOCUS22707 [Linum grandiflorum]